MEFRRKIGHALNIGKYGKKAKTVQKLFFSPSSRIDLFILFIVSFNYEEPPVVETSEKYQKYP